MSYNSATLSLDSTTVGGGKQPEDLLDGVESGHQSRTLAPSIPDTPPQRPQRRLSSSSLSLQSQESNGPATAAPTTTNRSSQHHPSSSRNSHRHQRNTQDNSHTNNMLGSHRSTHSSSGFSRESQHSFYPDSVQSSVTGPTYYDFPHYDIPEDAPFQRNWEDEQQQQDHRDRLLRQQPPLYEAQAEEDPFQSNSNNNKNSNNREQQHRPREQQCGLELEIQPGLFVPLRGSEETLDAMNNGFILQTVCFACTMKVLCIADSEYVLCPVCKVVSPIEHNLGSGTGVGLGLEDDQ